MTNSIDKSTNKKLWVVPVCRAVLWKEILRCTLLWWSPHIFSPVLDTSCLGLIGLLRWAGLWFGLGFSGDLSCSRHLLFGFTRSPPVSTVAPISLSLLRIGCAGRKEKLFFFFTSTLYNCIEYSPLIDCGQQGTLDFHLTELYTLPGHHFPDTVEHGWTSPLNTQR